MLSGDFSKAERMRFVTLSAKPSLLLRRARIFPKCCPQTPPGQTAAKQKIDFAAKNCTIRSFSFVRQVNRHARLRSGWVFIAARYRSISTPGGRENALSATTLARPIGSRAICGIVGKPDAAMHPCCMARSSPAATRGRTQASDVSSDGGGEPFHRTSTPSRCRSRPRRPLKYRGCCSRFRQSCPARNRPSSRPS